MTLTQQFLLVSLLPLSFIVMIGYAWRSGRKRRPLFWRWAFTLLMAAIWASSLLAYFGGTNFSDILIFNWALAGTYALSLTAVGVLMTTGVYLHTPRGHNGLAVLLSLLLLGTAVALDPDIWNYYLPLFSLGGQRITQFNIWGAVWIASWVLPILAAWLLVQQIKSTLPISVYRNQVNYWLLVVVIFAIGFGLASIRSLSQFGWQQVGLLVTIIAALAGTLTLTRSHLPELQLASRQVLSRLAGSLIIFGLTWFALSLLVRAVTTLPPETAVASQTLILIIAAALFAALFTLVYRWVNEFTRRIFLRGQAKRSLVQADYSNIIGNMPEPAQLGQMFLRLVQSNLATDDAWLFTAADGPGGRLMLRPLASLGNLPLLLSDFQPDSPISHHLRQNTTPLMQSDLDTLELYEDVPEAERGLLQKWQRVLYQPLHAGDSLIGVLALGVKYTGEAYENKDLALLAGWSEQISPLLAQAQNLARLRRINEHVFQQNQTLVREKQHLQELVTLYAQFVEMISPDLRRPFTELNREMQKYQAKADADNALLGEINQQIAALRAPIDDLITVSSRIQKRHHFEFKPLHLEQIAQEVMRQLHSMAEARRVKIDLHTDPAQATVLADEQQLLEAVQHLLHNAIKFNKIGGMVVIQCGSDGDEAFCHIIDNGVGIPAERLDSIWTGLHQAGSNGHGRRTGLGLALAQFIVKAHGGRIVAESKYGTGSTFTLYLPLVYEDA